MTARCEYQAGTLHGARLRWDGARHLIRETLHEQRMPWVEIVMMQRDFRMIAARLADCLTHGFALQEIEIERDGQNEKFSNVSFSFMGNRGSQRVHRDQVDGWFKTQDRLTGLCYGASLFPRLTPGRVPTVKIGSEDERRSQCSFPPIRPCLVMEASTSTIARTATSAVMSEIS